MSLLRFILTGVMVFVLSCVEITIFAAEEGKEVKEEKPLRITLELRDGSRIVGIPLVGKLPFQSSLTKMDIPIQQISIIKFGKHPGESTITFQNGDHLGGSVLLESITVESLVGKLTVRIEHITTLKIFHSGHPPATLLEGLIFASSFDEEETEQVTDASGREHHHESSS